MKFFEVFFNVVLLSYEKDKYLEGLKLENSENTVINPICDSQTSCVFTGGKTTAKIAAKLYNFSRAIHMPTSLMSFSGNFWNPWVYCVRRGNKT